MKKFLAVAAVLAVTSVNAEEVKFGDLNYFLKQGQFNVGVDAIVNNETSRVGKTADTEVDGYFLNTQFGFALTDSLNVTVGVNYLYDGETEVNKGASADDSGIQNPKFGINYRVMKQSDAGLNFDIGAVATIKVIDREVGTVDEEGNNQNPLYSSYADPRSTLDLNARLGNKWNEANEYYLIAGLVYHTDGEYEQLEGDMVNIDSSLDFKLGAFYQYRPVNEFMMTVGLSGTRYNDLYAETNSVESKYSDHFDFQFLFNAKYLVTENFITKFTFTKDNRDNFAEQKSGNTEYDKRNALQYGLGVDFLF
jgi:hypothetical protein